MNLLRRFARTAKYTLGQSSSLTTTLQPAYGTLLNFIHGKHGMVRSINDREEFRIDPKFRSHFPETYDPSVCDFLRERIRPGAVCLNIGAHVGVYALCLAEWSQPGGKVFAFEPNPATREVLQRHVRLNHFENRIEVVPQVVSDDVGMTTFYAAGLEGFSRAGQPNPHQSLIPSTAIEVGMTSIDKFCATQSVTPDWIVMDVEGYEVAALAGAKQVIEAGRNRLGIVAEMHPNLWESANTSREKLERVLSELSLRAIPLAGQRDALGEQGIVHLEYI